MDSWPAHAKIKESTTEKRKRKGKRKARREEQELYPLLEPGALIAAQLFHDGVRLNWTFLVSKDAGRRLVVTRDAVNVFPPTHPLPLPPTRFGLLQRTEQASHFLRIHHSDVEFASEIIREHLMEDAHSELKLRQFNPQAGNTLSAFTFDDGSRKPTAHLAFPMGEDNGNLNISPLSYTKRGGIVFRPTSAAIKSYGIPIQQITACPDEHQGRKDRIIGSLIAVRTFSSTHLINLTRTDRGILHYDSPACVAREDVGDKPIMDVIFPYVSNCKPTLLLVNEIGAVYRCTIPQGEKSVDCVFSRHSIPGDSDDGFWRLAQRPEDETAFLLSGKHLNILDFRTKDVSLALHSLQRPAEVFTSIDGTQEDHMIRTSSTNQILYIDKRYAKKPVLGLKHGRQFDRNLQVHSVTFANNPITFLTSRKNSLVTVYDVAQGEDNLVHLNTPPYCLTSVQKSCTERTGQIFFRHPQDTNDNDVCFLEQFERGDIQRADIQLSLSNDATDALHPSGPGFEWSDDIQEINKTMNSNRSDPGPAGMRVFDVLDLSPAYDDLFCDQVPPQENADAVYEILDTMFMFWQNLEPPIEYALTTYDIASRSASEPDDDPRTDFFSNNPLNSTRGFRALMQDRIPREQLIKHALWHQNLTPILRLFAHDIHEDPAEIFKSLQRYDLAPDDDRPAPSFRRESEAQEQLTLDLALSADVFCQRSVQKAPTAGPLDDAFENMSRAAEALSLGDAEPPSVQFGFLNPVLKTAVDHYANINAAEQTEQSEDLEKEPLGVRLLLTEWEVGSDPLNYTYADPYDTATVPSAVSARRGKGSIPDAHSSVTDIQPSQTQSQRPPAIATVAPSAPPVIASSQPTHRPLISSQSQEVVFGTQRRVTNDLPQLGHLNREPAPSNQPLMTSTQVLPGPHGGRLPPAKKKVVKKRVGGF